MSSWKQWHTVHNNTTPLTDSICQIKDQNQNEELLKYLEMKYKEQASKYFKNNRQIYYIAVIEKVYRVDDNTAIITEIQKYFWSFIYGAAVPTFNNQESNIQLQLTKNAARAEIRNLKILIFCRTEGDNRCQRNNRISVNE